MAAIREGRDAALAQAFAELVAAGEVVTVRALKDRAHVGTDAAAAWLKANRPAVEVPSPPQDFAQMVWPLAFAAARDVAMEAVAEGAMEAREGVAEALALAEVARAAQVEAEGVAERATHAQQVAERDAEVARAELVAERDRLAQAEGQVHELLAERDRLAAQVRDMEARAVRAETVADTMREVMDALRSEVRAAVAEGKK